MEPLERVVGVSEVTLGESLWDLEHPTPARKSLNHDNPSEF